MDSGLAALHRTTHQNPWTERKGHTLIIIVRTAVSVFLHHKRTLIKNGTQMVKSENTNMFFRRLSSLMSMCEFRRCCMIDGQAERSINVYLSWRKFSWLVIHQQCTPWPSATSVHRPFPNSCCQSDWRLSNFLYTRYYSRYGWAWCIARVRQQMWNVVQTTLCHSSHSLTATTWHLTLKCHSQVLLLKQQRTSFSLRGARVLIWILCWPGMNSSASAPTWKIRFEAH